MLNLFQALKSFPPFSRQLICKGMLFTNYDCPQAENKVPMFIEHSIILFVLSGRRIYHHQKFSWEMKEGSCAFVKKGGIISEKPIGEEWCVMAFFVPDDFLKQTLNHNRETLPLVKYPRVINEPVITLNVSEISNSCFFSMIPYFKQSPPAPENLLELKFKELVLSLLINPENVALLSYLYALDTIGSVSIPDIMQNNFNYHLSLNDYANLSCRSISTFKRAFKKHYNESPGRWVMRKRLEAAKTLLEGTLLTITEISMECGFENPSHFSRVFKEKIGMSPLQFRNTLENSLL